MTESFFLTTLLQIDDNPYVMETVNHLVEHWHSDRLLAPALISGGVGCLLLSLACLKSWKLHRSRHEREHPMAVFWRMAGFAGLGWVHRILLVRIARHQRLPSPVTLLVSCHTLHHFADRYVQTIAPRRRSRVMSRVADIRRRIAEAA